MAECILHMQHICKSFPGVKALNDVSLTLNKGDVLALVGENGAGKSTLMKILSGAYKQDSGNIIYKGKMMGSYTPAQAIEMGISVIYQELNDFPELDVARNIFSGRLPKKGPFIDYKKLKSDSLEAQKLVGLDNIHPFENVSELKVAHKQLIEIARSFVRNAEIIVMDEPTATLTDNEIEILYGIIRNFTDSGGSVIIITHKLEEVFEISNRAMVLRDGRNVSEWNIDEITKDKLVSAMVGHDMSGTYTMQPRSIGDVVLKAENISTNYLSDISFEIHAGEILSFYGLVGSGCDELTRCIFGAEKMNSGSLWIDGKKIDCKDINPTSSLENGLAFVPSERKSEGLLLDQSVMTNISLSSISQILKNHILNKAKEKEIADRWIKSLSIKTPRDDTLVDNLSGGNQQKIVFAKAMNTIPKVLILNEPTRGVDVGAKAEIYKLMEEFCNQGVAILMVSSEMPETITLSDRVITFYNGKITNEFARGKYSQIDLVQAVIRGAE